MAGGWYRALCPNDPAMNSGSVTLAERRVPSPGAGAGWSRGKDRMGVARRAIPRRTEPPSCPPPDSPTRPPRGEGPYAECVPTPSPYDLTPEKNPRACSRPRAVAGDPRRLGGGGAACRFPSRLPARLHRLLPWAVSDQRPRCAAAAAGVGRAGPDGSRAGGRGDRKGSGAGPAIHGQGRKGPTGRRSGGDLRAVRGDALPGVGGVYGPMRAVRPSAVDLPDVRTADPLRGGAAGALRSLFRGRFGSGDRSGSHRARSGGPGRADFGGSSRARPRDVDRVCAREGLSPQRIRVLTPNSTSSVTRRPSRTTTTGAR